MHEAAADRTLARAKAGDEHAFRALTDPYRRELQLHCYGRDWERIAEAILG